jgi:chromosome partitioning protein
MKIISIANQKGGCGKTTTAINLAASLSQSGQKTLLIDLDPQSHASLGLNFEVQESIYNVISKLTPRHMDILDIIRTVEDQFHIVPSNILVGTLEQELADEIGRELKLLEILSTVKERYDYILIDCSPSLGILTINAIRASDEVIIPAETSRFSIQGVDHLIEIITLIKTRLDHNVQYRVLVTMFDSRLRHSFEMLAKIRDQFGDVLFDTIVHTNVKLKESVVLGKTVNQYDKYCRGAKDYLALARELISSGQTMQEAPAQEEKAPAAATPAPTSKRTKGAAAAPQPIEADAEADAEVENPVPSQPAAESAPNEAPQPEFQPLSSKMQELVKEGTKMMFTATFTLKAPEAQSVYVTGSFNDWSLEESCRMRFEDGQWTVSVPLHPGLYKYQFIVDGRWREDPTNPRQERNSFGDINSIIEVKADAQSGA